MRVLRAVPVIVIALVAVGCAGGEGIVSNSVPSTVAPGPAGTAALTTVVATTEPAPGEWVVSTAPIVTEGIATQSDLPVQTPGVQVIGRTSVGWFVVGAVNGGFTVWRSTDLSSFEPVYSEVCCQRSLFATAIAEFDGSVLVGGTENRPDGSRGAFMLRSDDAGLTWSPIEAPLFTTDASRVDRIITIGDTVLVETLDDRVPTAGPRPMPAWSDDLATWAPVELPGALPSDWATFTNDDDVVFGVASRQSADGVSAGWTTWRSDDGGRTFTEASPLDGITRGTFVVAGGALVALPQVLQFEYVHADPIGPAVLGADGTWTQRPADTGTWGDGIVSFATRTGTASTSPAYVLVSRETRASVHYCYDDVRTCGQVDTALLVSADGSGWAEVSDVPGLDTVGRLGPAGVHAGPDGLELLAVSGEDATVRVTRWTGAEPPPVTERPDYPPPDIPVPLYEVGQDVAVGSELRYPLGLGTCGGLYTGDQRWEPEVPLPDPPPPEWPYRPMEISDGPDGYLYGRILRTAEDTIEFSIEGIGTVATFRPAPPLEFGCG